MPRAKKAVATQGIAGLPVAVQERIAAQQERFGSREKAATGKQLSIKNSKFKFEGADLGSEISVIILDYVFVNSYYTTDYDPDSITPPDCFAIADDEQELKPIEGLSNPQGDPVNGMCEGCWANAFESADRGKGKACQNRRRVAIISAEYFGQPDFMDTLTPENVGYLTMGGTSLAAWRAYTNKLGKSLGLAPFQVVTTLSFDDSVDYPKLVFTATDNVDNGDEVSRLLDVTDAIAEELRSVPDFGEMEVAPPKSKKKAASKKAASKKVASKKVASKKVAARAAPAASKKKAAGRRASKFS